MASVDHGSSHAHNLGAARVRSHTLCGIEVYCVRQDALPGRAWHQLSNRHPLLAIVVNEAGRSIRGSTFASRRCQSIEPAAVPAKRLHQSHSRGLAGVVLFRPDSSGRCGSVGA